MKRSQSKRVWFVMLQTLMMSSLYQICQAQDSFQLDSLYPKTWYAKATENCVQVWGTVDTLAQKIGNSSMQSVRFIDRAIGQLVFAQFCLDKVKRHHEQPLPEHVLYLCRVIGTIADRTQQIKPTDVDHLKCLQQRIEKMKKRVTSYLSKR